MAIVHHERPPPAVRPPTPVAAAGPLPLVTEAATAYRRQSDREIIHERDPPCHGEELALIRSTTRSRYRHSRRSGLGAAPVPRARIVIAAVVTASVLLLSRLTSSGAPAQAASAASPAAALGGFLSAPGGPFLRDSYGRAVILHGVNAVYKLPPYELYDAPGRPFDFSATDASMIAAAGFDVVRLGIVWEGLEPGTVGANDPAICTPGSPGDPGQFDPSVVEAYLAHVKQTVDVLASYHIYTLLDMHQDLYSSTFGGEGAPPWAVCSDGLSTAQLPGRWSETYHSPGLDTAFEHFWTNDVAGNLQGEYDRVWGAVASYFRADPWIVGYDLMNEPFSRSLLDVDHRELDAQIECFYTGTADPGHSAQGLAIACPADDPKVGLIPTIEAADPNHLIFYESDIFTRVGTPNFIGPMNFSHLVFNFHAYCPQRNPHTGDPSDLAACAAWIANTMDLRAAEEPGLASPAEPDGPPLFLSEFGATGDPALLESVTADADSHLLSWTYWSWKYYGDPTGSSDEALVTTDGQFKPTVAALAQAYPQAVAGTPKSFAFNATTGGFTMTYLPNPAITAPTIIAVPALRYPAGYCPAVTGAAIVSRPGASLLELKNSSGTTLVTVTVAAGRCAP
jgi:endoglycosylceramidase